MTTLRELELKLLVLLNMVEDVQAKIDKEKTRISLEKMNVAEKYVCAMCMDRFVDRHHQTCSRCEQKEKTTCAICLDVINDSPVFYGCFCAPFHKKCKRLAMRRDKRCPCCRHLG